MGAESEASDRYIVRGDGRFRARHPTGGPAGSGAPTRAVDRMLLALRAYEQRAHARAQLRLWLLTRRTVAETSRA